MGASFCKQAGQHYLMIGTALSGKTSLLFHAKLGKHVQVLPTVGYNEEEVTRNKQAYTITDLSVVNHIPDMVIERNGLLFVFDPTDPQTQDDQISLFDSALAYIKDKPQIPIAVLVNKQDLVQTNIEALQKIFRVEQKCQNPTKFFACSAVTGQNVFEPLQWLESEGRK